MRRVIGLPTSMIALALAVSAFFVIAIGSLLLVPRWDDILRCAASEEILFALGMSLATGVFSTLLVMATAIPIGYAFSRYRFPGQRIAQAVIYLPIAFPELVLGLCLLLLFGSAPVRGVLGAIGLDLVFTRAGIVAAQYFTALPYAVRVLKTVFDGIDPELEAVARSLGRTPLGTFTAVTLPLSADGLKAAAGLAFARCTGAFGSVLILAGGTRMETETLPIALYHSISLGDLDMAITAGIFLVAVAFVGIYSIETMERRSSAGRGTPSWKKGRP